MKDVKIKIINIDDTIKFAKSLAKEIKPNTTICLYGNLGVGKTVIAKAIGQYFGINCEIISPTFNILKTYIIKNKIINKINHFDLYRLKNISELENIGFEDIIYEKNVINIIEWPEIAEEYIKTNIINVIIDKIDDNQRLINVNYKINKKI